MSLNPFPNKKILDSSKLRDHADNNFKFDEDNRKFSKPVENAGGKGKIALLRDLYCRHIKIADT